MVIHEIYKITTRRKIVFFEEDPPEEAAHYLTGYQLCRISTSDIEDPKKLADVAAVIFRQRRRQPRKIAHHLKQFAETLLWHDCRVFVEIAPVVRDTNALILMRKYVVQAIEEKMLPVFGLNPDKEKSLLGPEANQPIWSPVVRILDHHDVWSKVAEDLRDYPPGVSPSLILEIEAVGECNTPIEISCERRILIQRAFHDCSNVKLVSNSEGRSGVGTYRAYATHKDEYVHGAPPYQYFVKIGDRNQISKEYLAYRDIALEHIPFHLGPGLRLDRCALGSKQGIIVSDYVSGAEKLRDCARDGRAVPVIASLFNTTLRSWRDGSNIEDISLQDDLKGRMPDEIPKGRKPLIVDFGDCKEPTELKALLEKGSSKPVQVGMVHGDLHSLNVLVRGGDAIVIDFEKVEPGKPLLLDLASLEAGLFVDGFIGDRRTRPDLLKSIESLFEIDVLLEHCSSPCDPSNGSAWFFDCVRQIRMQARQIELMEDQYALTLAVELAKKACKINLVSSTIHAKEGLNVDDVRAIAYVLAQRILVKLSEK